MFAHIVFRYFWLVMECIMRNGLPLKQKIVPDFAHGPLRQNYGAVVAKQFDFGTTTWLGVRHVDLGKIAMAQTHE